MSTARQHPRHNRRPGLYVLGGQVPADVPAPEDFPSEAAPAVLEPGNPPVCDCATLRPGESCPAHPFDPSAYLIQNPAAVAAAIEWDQTTAAEPYQVDVTRTMEDTVRIGNGLSAAVRLELLLDTMREEAQDGRHRDPVDGAELDPVDGLPLPVEPEPDRLQADHDRFARAASTGRPITWDTPADLAAPVSYALPRPVNAHDDLEAMPMTPERSRSVGGAPARVLNWTSRHDPRSLDFDVRSRLRAPAPLMDRVWEHGPILDQGTAPPLSLHDASGCTGHAGVNAANVLELATASAYAKAADVELYGHNDAMRLYERAQELDEVPGEAYPGTSILAVMKAGQEFGFWGSYLWAKGTRDVAQALLQVGPVVIGIPWLAGMTTTGPDGIVTVTGDQVGGHALCLHAIRMKVADKAGPWFGALQTWGEGVGDHGVVWFHHTDLARLLHGVGEAAIPVASTDAAL